MVDHHKVTTTQHVLAATTSKVMDDIELFDLEMGTAPKQAIQRASQPGT